MRQLLKFITCLNTAQHISIGKPETATAVVAPDDGHENARNMLTYI